MPNDLSEDDAIDISTLLVNGAVDRFGANLLEAARYLLPYLTPDRNAATLLFKGFESDGHHVAWVVAVAARSSDGTLLWHRPHEYDEHPDAQQLSSPAIAAKDVGNEIERVVGYAFGAVPKQFPLSTDEADVRLYGDLYMLTALPGVEPAKQRRLSSTHEQDLIA